MGFNYAHEKRKFDEKWKKLEDWYRKSGMSEDCKYRPGCPNCTAYSPT